MKIKTNHLFNARANNNNNSLKLNEYLKLFRISLLKIYINKTSHSIHNPISMFDVRCRPMECTYRQLFREKLFSLVKYHYNCKYGVI